MEVNKGNRGLRLSVSSSRKAEMHMGLGRLLLALALCSSLAPAQTLFSNGSDQAHRKGSESKERTVQGIVSDAAGNAVPNAIVQLKDTRTQQIRSFIAKEEGKYFFNGLSTDVDYELRADANGVSSGTKTLSSYDGRKEAVINLKLSK